MPPPRNNYLILLTDQQRWDAIGALSPWMRTPNLDRLAAEGTVFTQCITSSPQCIPARMTLMTGLYPHNTGVWRNIECSLNPAIPNWVQAFAKHGYRSSFIGKSHLHPHKGDLRERRHLMNAYGFEDVMEVTGPRASMDVRSDMTDHWDAIGVWDRFREDFEERFRTKPYTVRPSPLGLEDYYDVFVGRRAVEYLQGYTDPRPWFCWVGFPGPHEPWDTPEPYASMYKQADMPAPIPRPPSAMRKHEGHLDRLLRTTSPQNPGLRSEDIAAIRASYAGEVSLIDAMIGDIFRVVEGRGDWDRTVVVFLSDHGEMNGDYGLLYKGNFLESAVRIPLIVRMPESGGRSTANRPCDALVELVDLGPTLVEMIGAETPQPNWGRSFLPVLRGDETDGRQYVASEFAGEMMIRTKRWKMALNSNGEPYLLFDLVHDPQEQDNRAESWRTALIRRKLRDLLFGFLVSTLPRAVVQQPVLTL
jgi:choline-sulfatase